MGTQAPSDISLGVHHCPLPFFKKRRTVGLWERLPAIFVCVCYGVYFAIGERVLGFASFSSVK